jgi:transcriptional regulator with XRE-family HTH domain
MKQPELGKKIVELRKAKSLTQEELVDACNLNVRTLQRIESGEVTPRSYTLKLLSEVLDFDFNNQSSDNISAKSPGYFDWFKPIYVYVSDLFHLKTDTMRKVMTLTTVILAISICLMSFKINEVNTQSTKEVRKTIETMMANYQRWYDSNMVDSCITIFSDDVCLINNWLVLQGKEAVREQLISVQPLRYRIMENNIETFNLSGTIAVVRGNTTIKDIDGNIFNTKFLGEWHYIDGKWLEVNEVEVVQ